MEEEGQQAANKDQQRARQTATVPVVVCVHVRDPNQFDLDQKVVPSPHGTAANLRLHPRPILLLPVLLLALDLFRFAILDVAGDLHEAGEAALAAVQQDSCARSSGLL
eukprot:746872-Hanusia_phi.AAC.5